MKNRKEEVIVRMIAVVCLCCVFVGGVVALLIDSTDSLKNTFVAPSVDGKVNETFDSKEKKDVSVENTGNIDAYIRSVIVVNWMDDSGKVLAKNCVEGTDYTLTLNTAGNWAKRTSDGYWYFKNPVKPGAKTDVLITSCVPVAGKTPDGYHLSVEIVTELVQSSPVTAVKDAWGLLVSDQGALIVS